MKESLLGVGAGGSRGGVKRVYTVAGEREEVPQLPWTLLFYLLRMWDKRLESQKLGETWIISAELFYKQERLHNMQSLVQD